MPRVVVLIKGPTKTVDLPEARLTFWDYVNVETGVNDNINYNASDHVFASGYHTFKMIADELKELGAIELLPNKHNSGCTCTIKTDQQLELFKFGELLGFDENTTVTATLFSTGVVDINKGLRYIRVGCSVVKKPENTVNGEKSDVIVVLPITSVQPLKSSVQHFFDIESRVSINKGAFIQLIFNVTDQDGNSVNVGDILLDMYMTL